MIIKWKNKTKKNFRSYVKISSSSVHRVTHKTFSQFLKVDLLEMIRGDWLKWLKAQCCQIFWSHWILSLNCPSAFSVHKIQQNHRWPSLPASTSSTKIHQLRTRNWAVGHNISGKTVWSHSDCDNFFNSLYSVIYFLVKCSMKKSEKRLQ